MKKHKEVEQVRALAYKNGFTDGQDLLVENLIKFMKNLRREELRSKLEEDNDGTETL